MFKAFRAYHSKAPQTLKAVLFLGSVRENRMGSRVAKFMTEQLKQNNFEVDLWGKQKTFCLQILRKSE